MYALKLPIKNHSKQIFGPPEQRLLPGLVGWSWLSGAAKNEMEHFVKLKIQGNDDLIMKPCIEPNRRQSKKSQDNPRITSKKVQNRTSDFESVSASLCLMSRAIEKKTSSTFRFVFALCTGTHSVLEDEQFMCAILIWALRATYSLKKLDAVFICKRLTLRSWHSLRRNSDGYHTQH
jgi:hypothetical protein